MSAEIFKIIEARAFAQDTCKLLISQKVFGSECANVSKLRFIIDLKATFDLLILIF